MTLNNMNFQTLSCHHAFLSDFKLNDDNFPVL